MNVLISGSRGLIGSEITPRLKKNGHQVSRMVRSAKDATASDFVWNPMTGEVTGDLTGIDAFIHLAGESIASGRWTDEKKKQIRESRIKGTTLLSETIAKLDSPPKVMVCASAIGFYGDRGSEVLDENSPVGNGFLAELCKEWEEATAPARQSGIRVVNARIGVSLSPKGGALSKMLLPFQMGAGGNVGDGRQYMSWISIDDVAQAIVFCVENDSVSGPVNLTAPEPVPNSTFTKALGAVLSRPTIMPMPAFMARTLLGEMADELLLSSAQVMPKKLLAAGFVFEYPEIEGALRHVIKGN
ncbi:MAG: TIGR01777 family oxidoreductase [Candidatus Melainabacteria bacterium]|nr:TIGR01777 family oxidoreductase [Candidatus Melainabacteria bacterium]